jgi:hypothetical protein
MNDNNALLKLVVTVADDVFSLGRCWEDGEDLVHYAYSVRVEDVATGRRWAHEKTFRMTHDCHGPSACTENEDVPCPGRKQEFHSDRACADAAQALADKVAAAYKAGKWAGPIGNQHWAEVDPCYGSDAYEAYGVEAREAYLERREAGLSH